MSRVVTAGLKIIWRIKVRQKKNHAIIPGDTAGIWHDHFVLGVHLTYALVGTGEIILPLLC